MLQTKADRFMRPDLLCALPEACAVYCVLFSLELIFNYNLIISFFYPINQINNQQMNQLSK